MQVWKAWTPYMAMDKFPDLHQGLEFKDFEMVRPLLFLAQPQQEEGMRTRQALQKSIKKQAQVRAREEAPTEFLAYQKAIDEDLGDILLVAAEPVDVILRGPHHYIKRETEGATQEKIPLVQQKKDLISFLLQHTAYGSSRS